MDGTEGQSKIRDKYRAWWAFRSQGGGGVAQAYALDVGSMLRGVDVFKAGARGMRGDGLTQRTQGTQRKGRKARLAEARPGERVIRGK
jgi:hypothetical protein